MRSRPAIVLLLAALTIGLVVPVTVPDRAAAGTAVTAALPVLTGTQRLDVIGDSTTQAGGCQDGERYALGSWLTGVAHVPVAFVGRVTVGCHTPYNHCECWPGQTIPFMTANIDTWLAADTPTLIILRVGINDLGEWNGNRPPAQAINDMTSLVTRIRADRPTARIVVDQLFETNGSVSSGYAHSSTRARTFNTALPAAMAPFGDYVHVVETSLIPTSMLADGLHPNDTGLVAVAQLEYEALGPWLSANPLPRTDGVFNVVPNPEPAD